MNAVIKSADAARTGSVRAFGPISIGANREAEPWIDPELLALREEVERLQARVAEQQEAIQEHGGERQAAYAEGEAAGREAGRREADDGREALAARLANAARSALEQLSDELSSLERLAGLLAIEGIERILGPSEDRARQVLELIRTQIEGLQAQTVLRVEVSAADFPDSGQLAGVEKAVGRAGVEVLASTELNSGDCRIRLKLGAVEVGIGQQWSRLKAVLADLAEPRVSP